MLNNKIFITASLFVYAGIIIIVSHLSFKNSENDFLKINDKILHLTEYLIFGILIIRFILIVLDKYQIQSYLITFISGTVFAISDEIHQGFVGYFKSGLFGSVRNPDVFDFLADTTGIASSIFVFHIFKYFKNRNNLYTGTK